jgi:arsenite-transporting ATPase
VAEADAGRSTLVVSLDPAHSLGDALGAPLAGEVRRVAPRLDAVELDAERALRRWLRPRRGTLATVAERGTFLAREEAERLLDLSLPGVDELIGLVELRRLAESGGYDRVVVDTAPTGHTLRLLAAPEQLQRIAALLDAMQAKHRFLARHLGGRYRADASDALIEEITESARSLRALLRDTARAAFTWVLVAEPLALAETEDGLRELKGFGIGVERIVVNQLTPRPDRRCDLCDGRRRSEADVISKLRAGNGGMALSFVERQDREPRGRKELARFWRNRKTAAPSLEHRPVRPPSGARSTIEAPEDGGREPLQLPFPPSVRLVLFGGKGGVGKTTCAAATALLLARREPARRILLLSVDPAHSLGDVLGARVTDREARTRALPENLRVRELDATRELAVLRGSHEELLQRLVAPSTGVAVQPAFDREVMERLLDLAPPGLDELMALVAVARALGGSDPGGGHYDLVIVDSAPTGHALRLLALPDLAGRWTRALLELLREYREVVSLEEMAPPLLELSRGLRDLVRLLRDPLSTRFVAVTRPAALPRLETTRLLAELRRLHVDVGAVVVDALTPAGCGRCRRDAAREEREVKALRSALGSRPGRRCTMVLAPAVAPPPRGPAALARWTRSWRLASP